MHQFLRLATLAACALFASMAQGQSAQSYPTQPIRWIVPYSPGSFSDAVCRAIAPEVAAQLGQPLIIENRTGAGGTTGTVEAKNAPADGYTILYSGSSAFATNVTLMKLPYDPVKDFTGITMIGATYYVLAANPGVAAKNPMELAALSKKGALNYGSPGNGTGSHLSMELLKKATGAQLTHIPYKGSTPAVADLLGGHVQVMFDPFASVGPHIRAGKLKALAVASPKRMVELPDTPTLAELGVPGQDFYPMAWFGVVAPAGTPRDIVTKLNRVFVSALNKLAPKLQDLGVVVEPTSSEKFNAFIQSEIPRFRKILTEAGTTKVD